MWRIPPAPPGFFRLGKSLLSVEDTGAYFVSHERFCEAYYRTGTCYSYLYEYEYE